MINVKDNINIKDIKEKIFTYERGRRIYVV